jgi:hypothetical protein
MTITPYSHQKIISASNSTNHLKTVFLVEVNSTRLQSLSVSAQQHTVMATIFTLKKSIKNSQAPILVKDVQNKAATNLHSCFLNSRFQMQ